MIYMTNHVYKQMHDHDTHDKSCLQTDVGPWYTWQIMSTNKHDHDIHDKSCLQEDARPWYTWQNLSTNRSMTMIYMTNHVYKQIHDHEIHDKSCLQTDTLSWNKWHMSTSRYTTMKYMTYVCKQIHDHDIHSDGSSWRPTLPSKHKPLSRPAGARSAVFASSRGHRGSPCTSSITGGQGREENNKKRTSWDWQNDSLPWCDLT